MSRELQPFLAARNYAQNKPRNGTKNVNMDGLTIQLYCARGSPKDKDKQEGYAVPLRNVEIAKLLYQHPKFGERIKGEKQRLRDSTMIRG